MKYRIVWDNGASASGEFDIDFDTWEEADAFGKDWVTEMEALDAADGVSEEDFEDGYSYEIVEAR
jgi:hypothetical protein